MLHRTCRQSSKYSSSQHYPSSISPFCTAKKEGEKWKIKIQLLFLTRKIFISANSSVASQKQDMRKLLSQRNRKWKLTVQRNIDILFISRSFQGYRCKSGSAIFEWRVTVRLILILKWASASIYLDRQLLIIQRKISRGYFISWNNRFVQTSVRI